MDLIAFPLRISGRRIVTVPPKSDPGMAQRILAAFRTKPGELPLRPAYGTSDPIFNRIFWGEFFSTVSTYYKDIQIIDKQEKLDATGKIFIEVEFRQVISPETAA